MADNIKAAGLLFKTLDGKVLFLKRDDGGDHAGKWAFPGGKLEGDETTEQAARRESREELGDAYHNRLHHHLRHVADGVDFTTHMTHVQKEFDPKQLAEHDDYTWRTPENALEELDLHPGVPRALARLDMDELDVAKGIADGVFQSPQFFVNMWLWDIRITGTGLSYRSALEEHVWRDKSFYLNERFLERCQGLPVLWVHPKTRVITNREFDNRVIGTIMYPYIKDDEVWGIARIYDKAAAEEMMRDPISTSPGVSWDDPLANSLKELKSGEKLLIEDDPTLLDHIAIVPNGVWDKGGPPTGVRNDLFAPTERADSMTTETETAAADAARKDAEEKERMEREDRARKDADAGVKLDKVLSCLDAVMSRMDAFDKKDKERDDAARRDAQARRDAEREQLRKDAGEHAAADDDEEDKEAKEFEDKGDPKEVAADKARKSRKDRMAARADAARKDAEEAEAKKKEEEEEKAAKDAAARADAAGTNDRVEKLERELAAYRAMHRTISDEERVAMIDEQARADSLCRALGTIAPEPMAGETPNAYRIRLTRTKFQPHSKQWKDIDLSKLPAEALDVACSQIRIDAEAYSRAPTDVKAGTFREVVKIDPMTGVRSREFVGTGTFIGQMKRPVRYARLNIKPHQA